MRTLSIQPSQLKGALVIPPSKSQTMRSLVFALMAHGKSRIENVLFSPDTDAMLKAIEQLGARVTRCSSSVEIEGCHGILKQASHTIDAGNSGLVLRLIAALSSHLPGDTMISGDHSICNNRPMKPLLGALQGLGAYAISKKGDGFAPILIRGPIRSSRVRLCGRDSQPVSALLIASSFLPSGAEIEVDDPGEKPWIDLTLNWLDRFGVAYERRGYSYYRILGGASIAPFTYRVPADFSTMSFPLIASLVTRSELTLEGLDFLDSQGDKKLIDILQSLGAKIECTKNSLKVKKSSVRGGVIPVNDTIDALPILAALACFAETPTVIVGGEIARYKESNRIYAIAQELKKMGAKIEEREDGLRIEPSQLHGAALFSHNDHRIALSAIVAALGAKGASTLESPECIAKSYPHFVEDFRKIGAKIS